MDFTIYQTYQDSFGEGRSYENVLKDGNIVDTTKQFYQLKEDGTVMVKTKNISEETITSGSSAIFSFQSNKLLSIVAPDENDIGVITVNVGYLLSDY